MWHRERERERERERDRQTETGVCAGERIQMREMEGDRERQGWERDRVTGV